MDISDKDLQDEASSSATSTSASHDEGFTTTQLPDPYSTPGTLATDIPFHDRKWERLRRHYNDQYLELFKKTFQAKEEDSSPDNFTATQLGAVIWESEEKDRLFDALRRKGRHDLQTISRLVGSKSEVEVKAYLDSLLQQETDRQLFEAQPRNLSHAEIPASFEIGPDCEAVLDQAAEALGAFQEQYDFAVAQRNNPIWLIDGVTAAKLDEKADGRDSTIDLEDDSDGEDVSWAGEACQLFHLSKFLTLSERLFMNSGHVHSTTWHQVVEDGQRPAMTLDSVEEMFNLVTSFTRRLVQACIFMAKSRIRSSRSGQSRRGGLIRNEDISAALAVLGVKSSWGNFWVKVARRNGLTVVGGAHKKGATVREVMSYDEAELSLSRSSRPRSISITSEETLQSQSSSVGPLDGVQGEEEASEGQHFRKKLPSSASLSDDESDDDAAYGALPSSSAEEEEEVSPIAKSRSRRLSRRQRLELLGQEEDEYMERLDQEARRHEESRLLNMLNHSERPVKEEEGPDMGSRPKVVRKTVDDCTGWSANYQAEWERYGAILPPEAFAERDNRRKRRKLA
ncbi:hypothetical protein PV05_11094 [Exophiala xenobiotica]|uniref:Myb-like domain-containing protein n=1 Tax=Exophiala xenobiotica TaxID=348802 RepID=A0A0D2ENJ1_9EURO|nr:uncharacterized protein PV05_11094 [Exophiala xenobiotica]KIW49414.1 hypothetical protein PV05_11094 [Exophiala xenobiotica]